MKRLCAFVLLLAACGAPARKEPEVRVASILAIPFLPLYLADTRGFFQQEGLRVTIANLPGTSKATEALLGGSADVAGTALEHMMQLAPDGVSVKAFLNESPGVGIEEGQ